MKLFKFLSKGLNFIVSALTTIFPIFIPITRPRITLWGTRRVYYKITEEEYFKQFRKILEIIGRYYAKKPLTREELFKRIVTGTLIKKPKK